MSKITQGPWGFHKYPGVKSYTVFAPNRSAIASVRTSREDAAIMAASPEMFDALLIALPYVEDALDSPDFKKGIVQRDADYIRTVIAKAEGNYVEASEETTS